MLKLTTAIILTGGMSRRMGFSKETMNFQGSPLMDRLIRELSPAFEEIIVVGKNPQLYKDKSNVLTTFDLIEGRGPLGGLHAGLHLCKSDFAYLLACDMPFVNPAYIDFLKDQLKREMDALVCKEGDQLEPFHGFYNVKLRDRIEESLEKRENSITRFIKQLGNPAYISLDKAREFSPDLSIFTNINTKEQLMALENKDSFQESYTLKIHRVKEGNRTEVLDKVINECPLKLFVNGQEVANFYASPKSIQYLMIGHLYLKGYIEGYEDIENLEINKEKSTVYVQIDPELMEKRKGKSKEGHGLKVLESNELRVSGDLTCRLSLDFEKMSTLFADTGAAHSCGLIHEGKFIIYEEDVGRNNCIDKIIGRVLKDKIDLSDKILMTSCRISAEIMSKAIKIGLPAIVSVAAVTNLAVDLAKEYNVTLLGFTRGNRFNIYTNPDRVD